MRVHYIEEDSCTIAYFPRTLRYFVVNETMKDFINAVEEGVSRESIISRLEISGDQYDAFNEKIRVCLGDNDYLVDEYSTKKLFLEKLSLNISNDCNLRCKYCYANGGKYHSSRQIMTQETAHRALEIFFNHFDTIEKVALFGGEPTQNMEVIRYVCEYVYEKNEKTGQKTYLGMVTNGTQVTDELIELINKYDIQVTISFDGTKEAQDVARVFANGEGTAQVVMDNIRKLQQYTSQPASIEVTYHKYHQENQMKVMDIVRSIKQQIGDVDIHIVPMGCNQKEPIKELMLDNLDEFLDAIDEALSEKGEGLSYTFLDCILESLTKKTPSKYICDAAINALSVSTNGDIYPCSVLTDMKDEWGGSIYNENVLDEQQFEYMISRYLKFNKIENEKCSKCFAHTACFACLGMNAITNGSPFELDESLCELNRQMLEKIIIKLNDLQREARRNELLA